MQPGPSASLKCIAAGRPTPSLSWSLDGFPINHLDRLVRGQFVTNAGEVVSHVNISSVNPNVGGLYTCTATNAAGSVSHSARLNVYGLPVVRAMSNVEAVAGEVLVLHCPVGGFPIHSITWTKEGKTLPLNRRQKVFQNGTLLIHNVQAAADEGSYECSASTRGGHRSSQSITIKVVVPPRILPFPSDHEMREGSRLTLTCSLTEGDLPLTFIWFWNGRRLDKESYVSIHKMGEFSSYLVILNVRQKHNGNYTCSVSNMAGTATRSTTIYVRVPPKITPFAFKQNVMVGIRLQVSCTLEQGDLPVKFEWLKDGNLLQSKRGGPSKLSQELNLKIFQLDEFSSVLTVSKVKSHHSGNYTCFAMNNINTVKFTAPLTVSVPPRWSKEPVDVTTMEGVTVVLDCEAEGFPPPVTSWKREFGNKPGSFSDISRGPPGLGPGIQLLLNGSLLLQKASKQMKGKYLCEATNGIGPGLSKVVQVAIQAPPSFLNYPRNISAGLGEEVRISCDVTGDFPMDVTWYKDGSRLLASDSYRYEIRHATASVSSSSPAGESSTETFELILSNIDQTDGGKFVCTASNPFGSNSREINIFVLEPPSPPRSLHVKKKGSRFVELGWNTPRDGNTPITKYSLTYYQQSDSIITSDDDPSMSKGQEIEIEGHLSEAKVENLKPAKTYLFSLIAHNIIGSSKSSEALQVTLDGEAPSGPPLNLQARGISSTLLQLTWDPPEPRLTHGNILSYRVGVKEKSSPNQDIHFETVSELSLSAKSLNPFTEYSIVVQAVNRHGNGPLSKEVFVSTLEDVPLEAPSGITCSPMTSKSLLVSWEAMTERQAQGKLLGFKISYHREGEDPSSLQQKTTLSLNVALRGLRPHTNYSVRISGFTSVGEGPLSDVVTCSTEEDVPGVPAGIKGATAGASTVIVSWKPPLEPNGNILTYTLNTKYSSGSTKKYTIHHPISQYKIVMEKNQKSVQVDVAANTRVGQGPSTEAVQIHLKNTVPARIISWDTSLSIHRLEDATLPCATVGDPHPTIRWQKNGKDIPQNERRLKSYPDGALVIRNAHQKDSANYSCKAENIHGSDIIIYSLLVQMPPSAPRVEVKSAKKDSMTVLWEASSNGGAPLLGLTLSYKEDFGGWKEKSIPPSITSHVLTDLTCGRNYQVFATAVNKVGEGTPSEIVSARTAGVPPLMDQRVSPTGSNATWVSVSLSGWRDGGCPITHFGVAYRIQGESTWVIVSEQIKSTESLVEIGDLKAHTSYVIRVTAHNSAGVTTHDYTIFTTTVNGELPPSEFVLGGFPPFLKDLRVVLPLVASLLALISACVTVSLCIRRRPSQSSSVSEGSFDCTESFDDCEKQKEHFYATIKRMSPPYKDSQASVDEDGSTLHQYATFQMNDHKPQGILFQVQKEKPVKGNLSGCHYHHQDLNPKRMKSAEERVNYQQRYRQQLPIPNPNYCSFAKFIPARQSATEDTLDSSYLSVECDSSLRRQRLSMNESDEYDTFGSDSDVTPVTFNKKGYSYKRNLSR